MAESGGLVGHTFGPDCTHCGDGSSGVRCDLSGYSARRVRFILAHREAYDAAYLNPDRTAAKMGVRRPVPADRATPSTALAALELKPDELVDLHEWAHRPTGKSRGGGGVGDRPA